jgi:UDP-N-acetylglucosamine:LPS N-acetylglucosamine transferase
LKVLILSFYYKPDLSAGSFRTTAFVDSVKNKFSENDTVEIITTMPNRYSSFKNFAEEIEKDQNITIRRIPLPPHKSGFIDQAKAFSVFFIKTIKIVYGKEYDAIYATSSRLFTAFLGAVVSKIKKARLYLDIRDIFTDTMDSILSPKLKFIFSPFFKLIEKFTINQADRINLVSEGFLEYFRKIKPGQQFTCFTNGIDDAFLNFNKVTSKGNKEKKVITYAGNIGKGQGLERIVPEIATLLKDKYEFWIIGDGGEREELYRRLLNLGINNAKLINPVNREVLIEYYQQSDFLFLHLNDYPAFKKVLPSKIFEYSSFDKPIIAGVSGYSKKFISENVKNAMVFTPCSSADFIEKFNNFDFDFSRRKDFIKKFSRKSIMDRMAEDFFDFCKNITKTVN